MNKPIATIHHQEGKRSTVYADDYNRLSKLFDELEAEHEQTKLDLKTVIRKRDLYYNMIGND